MKNKKLYLGLGALLLAVVVFLGIYLMMKPQATAGGKNIVIEVVNSEQNKVEYQVSTDAEYLRQAMEETDGLTFSGEESEYGLMVLEVNGETADYNVDGAYWAFYVNDDYCQYGVDEQVVQDKDVFRIEYTVY